MKRLVKDIFRVFGLDVGRQRSRRTLEGFLELLFNAYNINIAIDVGANVGQYAAKLRRMNYHGRIISFEPVPKTFSLLFKCMGHDPNWLGYMKALGCETADVKIIYEPGQSDMASLYNPSSSVPDMFLRWRHAVKNDVTVQMDKLDNVFADCVADINEPNVFLKCDTQGHDLEVLKGGRRSLEKVRAIQIEIPIFHLYEGTSSFGNTIDSLKEMNFEPCAFYPVVTTGSSGISVVEFDCIAVRST